MRARGRQGSRAAAGPPAARGRRRMPVAWSATRGGPRFRAAARSPVRPCAPLRARAVPALRPCACRMRPAIPASRRPPCAARPAAGHAGTAQRPPRSAAGRTGRRPLSLPLRALERRRGRTGRRVRHAGRECAAGSGRHAGAAPCVRMRRGAQPTAAAPNPRHPSTVPHGERAVDPAGQIRIPRRRSGRPRHRPAPRGEPSPAIPGRRRLAPCGPHPRPPDPRGSSCRRPRRPSPWPEGGGA